MIQKLSPAISNFIAVKGEISNLFTPNCVTIKGDLGKKRNNKKGRRKRIGTQDVKMKLTFYFL